ncbi:hypothetical protein BDW59DRAFT_164386 [Aspergillus cavernicola]|uniref:Uncharacterized protein n=1 Tax=Aspergillus cavernicola TaxID=176166 RepID=A0ABR4I021_9EURO
MDSPSDPATHSDGLNGIPFSERGFGQLSAQEISPTSSRVSSMAPSNQEVQGEADWEQYRPPSASTLRPSSTTPSIARSQRSYVLPSVDEGLDELPRMAPVECGIDDKSDWIPLSNPSPAAGSRGSFAAPSESYGSDRLSSSLAASISHRPSGMSYPISPHRGPSSKAPSVASSRRPSMTPSMTYFHGESQLREPTPVLSRAASMRFEEEALPQLPLSRITSVASSRRGSQASGSERGVIDLPLEPAPRSVPPYNGQLETRPESRPATSSSPVSVRFGDQTDYPLSSFTGGLAEMSLTGPSAPEYKRQLIDLPVRSSIRSSPSDNSHLVSDPALSDEPYLARSRATSRAASSLEPNTPRNGRYCTTLDTMCEECRYTKKTITPTLPDKYLTCPLGTYPVMLECVLMGTADEASDIASKLAAHINQFICQKVSLHAVVRRSAAGGHGAGRWYDVTTRDYPAPMSLTYSSSAKPKNVEKPSNLMFWRTAKINEKKRVKKPAEKPKFRDFRILLDFPVPIEPRGPAEKHIVHGLPNNVKIIKVKIIKTHHTLHRLCWWARTHPKSSGDQQAGHFLA